MLKIEDTVLLVIDIQGKLWNVMSEKQELVENTKKLIKGMQILGVPIILTEQNPNGLGPTLPELTEIMPGIDPLIKFAFSCWQEPSIREAVEKLNRKQVLLCGIETHICCYQTTLDLLQAGYEVHVAADCVTSRSLRNRDIALSRIQSEGAKLTLSEMAIYEMMQTAKSPYFKPMLPVIK